MEAVNVSCCQIAPHFGDVAANRSLCERAVAEAAGQGAELVVLPELATTGYVFTGPDEAAALAEPADGPSVRGWVALAGRLGVTIVGGWCERGSSGHLYNSAAVVTGDGVAAVYRKAHLWDGEKLIFSQGSARPPVLSIGDARISVMICYDLEFPEWVRLPALAGAQLLCVPANWPVMPPPGPPGERPMEVVRAQAAASTNRIFIAVCDRVGPERGVDWVGHSVICDPDGWPITGPAPAAVACTIGAGCSLALADNKAISGHNDVLADRRPGLYRALGEGNG